MLLVGSGIGILILSTILKKIFKKDKVNPYMQVANCSECDWQGQVNRHAGRCPGCNMPLGDRTITRLSGANRWYLSG